MNNEFPFNKITVTGGAGFLGNFVIEKLRAYPNVEVFIPRSAEYDLTEKDDVVRMLTDAQPDLVIHPAQRRI